MAILASTAPQYADTITLIAVVMILLSSAMAIQRSLTAEQPGWHRMFNSRTSLMI